MICILASCTENCDFHHKFNFDSLNKILAIILQTPFSFYWYIPAFDQKRLKAIFYETAAPLNFTGTKRKLFSSGSCKFNPKINFS